MLTVQLEMKELCMLSKRSGFNRILSVIIEITCEGICFSIY